MFKGNLSDGTPVTKEYFLSEEVDDSCVAQGILEDVNVEIEAGMNQYLGLDITQIRLAETDDSLGEELF